MAKIDFSGLTNIEPIAVQSISELIKAALFNQADLSKEVTIIGNIEYDQNVGYLGKFGHIGKKKGSTGCSLNEIDASLAATEKTWAPKNWDTRLIFCADDYVNNVGEKALKKGIDRFDMMDTELMKIIVEYLMPSVIEMYNRFIWMNDLTAAHTDDSPAGNITPALSLDFVNIQDALWKKAFALATAAPTQRITIAANAQTTYATQLSELTPTLALSYANSLYYDAPLAVRQNLMTGNFYYKCTLSFFDKLAQNFQGVGSTAPINIMLERLENGIQAIRVNGVLFVPDPVQDDMINTWNNTGTAWFLPHRVILCAKDNLLMGVPDVNTWANFDMFYDKVNKKVYIDMADKYDVMFLHDNLVMMAF